MQPDLPILAHLEGSPSYEVLELDGAWGWSIETATENWERYDYASREDAVASAWEHAIAHFGIEEVRRG